MERCSKCFVDRDLCPCVAPTADNMVVLMKQKEWLQEKLDEVNRLIREELLKKKLRL